MERIIKFRAWDGQTMVYDFTPRNITGTYSGKPAFYDTRYGLEVPPNNVMQFTGLQDKNGKDIYESDLLRFSQNGKVYTMGFENGKFDLIDFDSYGHDQQIAIEDTGEWEVIGNIYETPNLLK